jgi:hypothetical protein
MATANNALATAEASKGKTRDMINRSEVNRALAKAIAYKQCGNDNLANQWAAELACLLECGGILRDGAPRDLSACAKPVREA